MKLNTRFFFAIWGICVALFIIGQLEAPPNYAQLPGNPWGALFGTTFVVGSVSFVLMVVMAFKERGNKPSKKVKNNFLTKKYKQYAIYAGLGLLGSFILFSPFRYEITGTNQGYIYKTDRLTGRSFIVSPGGEIEVTSPNNPTPEPARLRFPLELLDIVSIESTRTSLGAEMADVVIRNRSVDKNASNIKFKITYSKTKDGDVFDTDYHTSNEIVNARDTKTISIPLSSSGTQYWYTIQIVEATQ